jgi:hypothetical protein
MRTEKLIAWAFIAIPAILIFLKLEIWGYTFDKILPQQIYEVNYNISAEAFNENININTYLPISNHRQFISEEINSSPNYNFSIEKQEDNKKGIWLSTNSKGVQELNYFFKFQGKAIEYQIDTNLSNEQKFPPGYERYLKASENIQVNHPQIQEAYIETIGDETSIYKILKAIHQYTKEIEPRPFKGLTDALTALRLGEASCNGKSRLFIALARSANIPSRLVGGLILESGNKKTSHQWVEAYINGNWVPFDPLNNHFAFIPHNYLSLYYGDHFLFSHTPNINFDYHFTIKPRLSLKPAFFSDLENHPFNAYNLWQAFENIGIPIGLIKIILLFPLGALIVAIFRNVIGLKTFGIFLPALIAIACRETGLVWGLTGFAVVLSTVSLVHFPMERLGILYTPKLVIMLVSVVLLFLAMSYFAIEFDYSSLAYITMFPIVVLTLSAERFARTISEESYKDAVITTLQTMIVAAAAFVAMNSQSMEAFFIAFPELFLAIVGINLFLGRWIGLRVSEYVRFKWLIQ